MQAGRPTGWTMRLRNWAAAGRYCVLTDLTCYGKIIGGGNPTAAAAATLRELSKPGMFERLQRSGEAIRSGISAF